MYRTNFPSSSSGWCWFFFVGLCVYSDSELLVVEVVAM
jgi:hypothetical protein